MLTKSYLKKFQWVILRLRTNSVNCQIAIKNCKIRRLRWMLIQSIFGPLRHQHWQPHRIVDNKTATLFMALGFTCGVGCRNPRPFPHVQHWWQRSKIVASPWWTRWSSTSWKRWKQRVDTSRKNPALSRSTIQGFTKIQWHHYILDEILIIHWPYVFSHRSSFVSLADVNIVEIIDSPATLINFSSVGKTLEK